MRDKLLMAIAGVLGVSGGFVAGILIRQPEINKLHKQVKQLQKSIKQLEDVVEEQNAELTQMLIEYKALKIYQISKRRKSKDAIQDTLIVQYATNDYLTLLVKYTDPNIKMAKEEIHFYKSYSKMLSDNQIDSDEIEVLRPLVIKKHPYEIKHWVRCNTSPVLDEIRTYNKGDGKKMQKGLFGNKEESRDD